MRPEFHSSSLYHTATRAAIISPLSDSSSQLYQFKSCLTQTAHFSALPQSNECASKEVLQTLSGNYLTQ